MSGKADITITPPPEPSPPRKHFQYLQSENFYAKPAFDRFVIYDQSRQWLYLSDIDHVDVFELVTKIFHQPGIESPGGPPPTAGLRGLALTPNGSQLVAADFGSQSIYLFDPDNGSGTTVAVGGVGGFANSRPARSRYKYAKCFCRLKCGVRVFRRLHILPRPVKSHGQPSNHSTGLTARSHQPYRCASRSIQWQWRSGVRRVRLCTWRTARPLERIHSQSIFNLHCE